MKRNIRFSVVFAVMMVCFAMVGAANVNAATEESQFEWKCDYKNNTAVLTKYVGNSTSVQVPQKVNGCKVTGIGYAAFANCKKIKNIDLSSSLKWIAESSFNGCSSLKSIKFPQGMEQIGPHSFGNCTSLESILIPNSIKMIGWSSFWNCSSIKKAIIYGSPVIESEIFMKGSKVRVYGYAGSTVQEVAKENGVRFVALNKPTSLKGTVVSKKYGKLSWKSAKGAAGYQIYRSTKKSSGYAKIAETKGTTYTDKKVKRGGTYYYKVRVYMYDVDKVKIYGNYTGAVVVKIPKK